MVLAPVAASAAVAAVDDEGLINKLFKIGILIGILVLAVISIVILSWILDIANILGAAGDGLGFLFAKVSLGGIPIIGPAVTFILTAFSFGGRN
jgi:hypothetical protein